MSALRIGGPFALVTVFCVLAIFFFPAATGPYSAIHGPVTALLAVRAAARVHVTIMRAGLNAIRSRLQMIRAVLMPLRWAGFSLTERWEDSLCAETCSVLRC